MNNKGLIVLLIVIFSGLGFGVGISWQNQSSKLASGTNGEGQKIASEPEVLYWVAPMDDNFRRDKPGKSPMGMDLVPVYANEKEQQAGVINISPQVENSIGVRTGKVTFDSLVNTIKTSGYVGFDQDKLVHVYPRVEGWIEQLMVSATGDKIVEGTALFSLYSPNLVNAQQEYLAALKRGNKQIVASSYNRLIALGISKQQIMQLKTQRKAIEKVVIYAQSSGYLSELNVRQGQFIRPQDKLMSIADISSVWVMVEVFERQAHSIAALMSATMTTPALPGQTWQGKVVHIHPFLMADTRTLRVRLHFDNHDERLKPNMFVNVDLVTGEGKPILSVPSQAVIRTGKQNRVVRALGDGRFSSVAVHIGAQVDDRVIILNGLKQGQSVVTSAQFLLDSESSTEADFTRMEVNDEVDHSNMDHSDMDHSDMDHSNMDDSNMDHSQSEQGDNSADEGGHH